MYTPKNKQCQGKFEAKVGKETKIKEVSLPWVKLNFVTAYVFMLSQIPRPVLQFQKGTVEIIVFLNQRLDQRVGHHLHITFH